MSNNTFWKKSSNRQTKMKNFSNALDNIKKKNNWNIIDKRLLSIINEFSGGKGLDMEEPD